MMKDWKRSLGQLPWFRLAVPAPASRSGCRTPGAWLGLLAAMLLTVPQIEASDSAAHDADFFELAPEELAQVDVVSGSLAPQPLSELPASLSVITRRQIRESGARNLYDLLRLIPGVRVDFGNRGRPVISVRGVRTDSSNHLLFLLDGHVLNEPGTGSAAFTLELTRLPLQNIQRIEILRGPGSLVFGANAFLGAVNIITRSPRQIDGTELSLRTEFDAAGEVGQALNFLNGGVIDGDLTGSINLNLVNRPGEAIPVQADAAGRAGRVDNDLYQFDLQARLESRHTRLTGRFSRQERGEHYGVFYQLAPDDRLRFEGGYLELLDSRPLAPTLELRTRAYLDVYTAEARISRIPRGSLAPDDPAFGLNARGAYAVLLQDLAKYGLEARLALHGAGAHRLTTGLKLEYQSQHDIQTLRNFVGDDGPFDPLVDISDVENFTQPAHRLVSAVFVEDLWKIAPELNLNLGLRLDHYSDAGWSLSPRLGLNWRLYPGYHLRALWGTAFREPDFRSMYLDAGSFFGNPDLHEEHISSAELGLDAQLTPRLGVSATLFHNRLEDLISLSPETARFENQSRLSTRGLELAGRYDFRQGASVALSYSYAEVFDGDTIALMPAPRHSGSLLVTTPLGPAVTLGMDLYWQSDTLVPESTGEQGLDGFLLFNTRLGYRWNRHLSLEAAVYNLLDQDYAYPAPADTYPDGLPAAGRSAMLGLKLEL